MNSGAATVKLSSIEIAGRPSRRLYRGMLAGFGETSADSQSPLTVTEPCILRRPNTFSFAMMLQS